jgi:hypothetical protein
MISPMSFCRVISTYCNVLKLINNEKEIYVMSKFSRLFLITMMLMIISIPLLSAQADEKVERWAEWPTYYSLTDPGNAEPPAAPWQAIVPPINLNLNDEIWFGTVNVYVDPNTKFYRLSLTGVGLAGLGNPWARGYYPGGAEIVPLAGPNMFFVGGTLNIDVVIDPQPQWEVVKLTATGEVTINDAVGASGCTRVTDVPMLTTVGIIALALLLIASTIWVMRKRKAGLQI